MPTHASPSAARISPPVDDNGHAQPTTPSLNFIRGHTTFGEGIIVTDSIIKTMKKKIQIRVLQDFPKKVEHKH